MYTIVYSLKMGKHLHVEALEEKIYSVNVY